MVKRCSKIYCIGLKKKDFVWVYLEDLSPDQMIEYGEILLKSGQEKKWFNSLTPSLRKKLKKMEKRK